MSTKIKTFLDENGNQILPRTNAKAVYMDDGSTILDKINASSVGKNYANNKGEIFNDYENNIASGEHSHAEGTTFVCSGSVSANGETLSYYYDSKVTASGIGSHAEGCGSVSSGEGAHAEGICLKSHEGAISQNGITLNTFIPIPTIASGKGSHAEGVGTSATAIGSHSEGTSTKASGENQHVQGKYNIADTTSAHIIGNGTSSAEKSNAHTLDWDGNAWFAGDVYIGSTSGKNKDSGSKKLATIADIEAAIGAAIGGSY